MFEFATEADKEIYLSLKSNLNKNMGFFKSDKQALFLFKSYSARPEPDREGFKKFMGVDVSPDQIGVTVTAYNRWAGYGSRSVIPSLSVFVLDKFGVVALYKIRGNGNLRDGWGPNPEKTELVWSRPADAVCPWTFPTLEEVAKEVRSNEWIGSPGQKIEVVLKFLRGRDMGSSQWGNSYLSVFEDEAGNVVNIWKFIDVQPNEFIKVKGTVKSTDDYKGRKQTTLIRVKEV
jgi:thiol-disulfide isomerase/thioredoxin